MLHTVATVIAIVLGIHIVAKFAFFALPYRRRRAVLDKQYGAKPSATTTSDVVLMVVTAAIAVVVIWRGIDPVSFLAALWIGATLIQLYFHQFHVPVPADRAAPPEVSPLKQMSYAIQASPWRPWPQMLALTVLVVVCLVVLVVNR